MSRLTVPAVVAAALLALAGCGAPRSQTTTTTAATTGTDCTAAHLQTLKPGTLTVGTDKPAYEPWFSGNDPSNGKGYESAVAYAVADRLGYAKDKVTWATVTFNQAIAPGPKTFDLDLNQVSISAERRKALDFSTGYYDVRQAVVTTKGSAIAGATSVASLKGARLGAQVGSTSLQAAQHQIAPSQQVAVFDSNDLAVQALKAHQVDGLVVDVPTAFYMTSAQLDGGVIVGQLAATGGSEQFGAVLAKGSPLTGCVSQAVDALRKDGTLARLQQQWLTASGARELS